MPQVTIHDFRIVDRVLGETDTEAGDVVFLGAVGNIAAPFVVARTVSGPGGVYIDAFDIVDADGRSLGTWERQYEIEGESKPRSITTEVRGLAFPQPGTYALQYFIYDDLAATFSFTVTQESAPAEGIVPGPLDAALSKSTIAWLSFGEAWNKDPVQSGSSVKQPRYNAGKEHPVWYGYENGKIYVLSGAGEQPIAELATEGVCRLVARSKDKRSMVAEVECEIGTLAKGPEWDHIARDVLVGRRLNLRDGDGAVTRWRDTCEIYVLSPLPPAMESAS